MTILKSEEGLVVDAPARQTMNGKPVFTVPAKIMLAYIRETCYIVCNETTPKLQRWCNQSISRLYHSIRWQEPSPCGRARICLRASNCDGEKTWKKIKARRNSPSRKRDQVRQLAFQSCLEKDERNPHQPTFSEAFRHEANWRGQPNYSVCLRVQGNIQKI